MPLNRHRSFPPSAVSAVEGPRRGPLRAGRHPAGPRHKGLRLGRCRTAATFLWFFSSDEWSVRCWRGDGLPESKFSAKSRRKHWEFPLQACAGQCSAWQLVGPHDPPLWAGGDGGQASTFVPASTLSPGVTNSLYRMYSICILHRFLPGKDESLHLILMGWVQGWVRCKDQIWPNLQDSMEPVRLGYNLSQTITACCTGLVLEYWPKRQHSAGLDPFTR